MNYHNITKDDMLNGDGLRVVLWVSGCTHHCPGCQNPITWDVAGGLEFDENAENELFEALAKPHCSGITFSGGDPLHPFNREEVFRLIKKIRQELLKGNGVSLTRKELHLVVKYINDLEIEITGDYEDNN